MQPDKPLFCPECGRYTVQPCQRPGRTMRYRNLGALILPEDFAIPTCSACGTETLDTETRTRVDAILSASYQHVLRQRIRRAIDTLMSYTSLRRLELLLGLSQGYLSRLRLGAGNPSAELVSHLALIAKDPSARLSELQQYWAEPEACVVSPLAHDTPGNETLVNSR